MNFSQLKKVTVLCVMISACGVQLDETTGQSQLKQMNDVASISAIDAKGPDGEDLNQFEVTCKDGRIFKAVPADFVWGALAWDALCTQALPNEMLGEWYKNPKCQQIPNAGPTDPASYQSTLELFITSPEGMNAKRSTFKLFKDNACGKLFAKTVATDIIDAAQTISDSKNTVYQYSARTLSISVLANAAEFKESVDFIKKNYNLADFSGYTQKMGSIEGSRYLGALVLDPASPNELIDQTKELDATGKVIDSSIKAIVYTR